MGGGGLKLRAPGPKSKPCLEKSSSLLGDVDYGYYGVCREQLWDIRISRVLKVPQTSQGCSQSADAGHGLQSLLGRDLGKNKFREVWVFKVARVLGFRIGGARCTRFKALSELCRVHGGEYVLQGGRCRLQRIFKLSGGPFAFWVSDPQAPTSSTIDYSPYLRGPSHPIPSSWKPQPGLEHSGSCRSGACFDEPHQDGCWHMPFGELM